MAKDSPRTTAGELQKIVESRVRKPLINKRSNSTHITTCCLGGFQENKLQHIQLSDTTGTSNGTGFYGQMKLKKNCFLAANTQDGFGEHRDKKYPLSTIKYTPVFCDCYGPIFLLEFLDILFRHMALWIISNTNR